MIKVIPNPVILFATVHVGFKGDCESALGYMSAILICECCPVLFRGRKYLQFMYCIVGVAGTIERTFGLWGCYVARYAERAEDFGCQGLGSCFLVAKETQKS